MAGSAEKRPRDGAGSPPAEGRRSKRRRWDSDAPPAEPPPPPPAPPAAAAGAPAAAAGKTLPDTSALAKAKAVLAKQKALAEKLKKLKKPETEPKETASEALEKSGVGAAGPGGAAQSDAVRRALEVAERARAARAPQKASATARDSAAPRALLLNEKGEEVDEEGNVLEPRVGGGVRAVSTFKVNAKTSEEKRKVDKLEAFAALRRETAAEVASSADLDWVDPSVSARRRGGRAEFKVRLYVFAFPTKPNISFFSPRHGRLKTRRRREASFQSPAAAADADRSTRGLQDATPTVRRGGLEFGFPPNRAAPRRHTVFSFQVFRERFSRLTASYTLSRGCSFLVAIFMLAITKLGRWKADARMAATPSPERHAFRFRRRRLETRLSALPDPRRMKFGNG